MSEKIRVDVALVNQGLCESREKAQASIMAGLVYIGERKVLKPSEILKEGDELVLRGPAHKYASRGGLKLEKAIKSFGADVTGKVCMDIGCATGGFTDVLLQNGAAHVYAIDVGYGQFDWKLRNKVHQDVLKELVAFCPSFGWQVQALDFSPITGPEGNIEFLAKVTVRTQDEEPMTDDVIRDLVSRAHAAMKK